MTERVAILATERLAWRSLLAATLLSTLLGFAVTQSLHLLAPGGSSSPPAARGTATVREGLSSLSAAARASISAALGAEELAYHFTGAGGELQAANPAQHLHIDATRAGVLLRAHRLQVGLQLRAIGDGRSWRAVRVGAPAGASNRVTYAGGGVSEWYVNGPLGLEQGFTLARPAGGTAGASVTLAIGVSGGAHASLAAGGQSVRFTAPGARALRYGGLSVSDAAGRTLGSHLGLQRGRLLLSIDTRGARYPLRVDPVVGEEPQQQLAMPGGAEGERAGVSVAVSANGSTAVVGAPDAQGTGGAVWVFRRSGKGIEFGDGEQLAIPEEARAGEECTDSAAAAGEDRECDFGRSVAISASGQTVLVGAPFAHEERGAAWILTYSESESRWEEIELLDPHPGAYPGHFGRSVAMSGNGETALIGAPGSVDSEGRAWLFTCSGSGCEDPRWEAQQQPLAPEGEEGAGRFGVSVALSYDGEAALVGAPADDRFLGAAWVFERSGSSWLQHQLAGHERAGHFGFSVALSGEGTTALVGAPFAQGPDGTSDSGAASVFTQAGGWAEQASFSGEDGEGLGYSVALSPEGEYALVGAPGQFGEHARGRALEYAGSQAGWSEIRELEGRKLETGKARFGTSVSLSARAETALAGGPAENGDEGAAWVFNEGPIVESVTPDEGRKEGGTKVVISGLHFAAATAVHFGPNEASFEVSPNGESITAISPPGQAGQEEVHVTVTTPLGTSDPENRAAEFFYTNIGGEPTGDRSEEHDSKPVPEPSPEPAPAGASGSTHQGTVQVLALGPSSGGACGVALLSSKIAVQGKGSARLKLRGTGSGSCTGRATLSVRVKVNGAGKGRRGRTEAKIIGTASFAIAAGRTLALSVELNAAGRALLAAGHGRLSASLLILKSSPAPSQAHTASVRLTRQRPSKPARKPKA